MSAPFTVSASSSQPSPLPSSSSSSSSSSPSSNLTDGSKADRTIETLQFDNLVLRTLPIDKEKRNFTREVPDACFSLVEPTPVRNPQLVCVSPDALSWIELSPDQVSRPDFVEYFSGNKIIPGTRPAAHCYCGHQFGHFSGQLGDGATMYLGEIVTSRGERVELQFKGAGMTPYSRSADGRKVLRSSIREFLCSEGHHYLGIPTTRAGTIVTSDTLVERDLFYDGNVIQERATVITRLAPSFLRFGSFEIAKGVDSITGRSGPSPGRFDIVQKMLDYVIEIFYPDVVSQHPPGEERYLAFFDTLTRRTALLVAKWQSVGWAHGVLNTDNMSILGLTIDYGPFGFMEAYDPEYICNGSDHEGRYRFESQPEICGWNLLKLSQMFESFVPKQKMRDIIGKYEGYYESAFFDIQRKKFGFDIYELESKSNMATTSSSSYVSTLTNEKKQVDQQEESANVNDNDSAMEGEDDNEGGKYHEVITSFYSTMGETGADFTTSFRCLSSFDPTDANSYDRTLTTLVTHSATVATRLATLAPRIPAQQMAIIMQLMQTSPHIFQQPGMEEQRIAIEEEIERRQKRAELAKQTQAEKEAFDRTLWRQWLDSYRKILMDDIARAESFGNHTPASILTHRRRLQNSVNPKFILRNWIAQQVIHAAEKGDYTPMKECLERLRDPYDIEDQRVDIEVKHRDAAAEESTQTNDADQQQQQPAIGGTCSIDWGGKRPAWADKLRVTCSS